jgi:hypothetical protein
MREAIKAALAAWQEVYSDFAMDMQEGGNPSHIGLEQRAEDAAVEAAQDVLRDLLHAQKDMYFSFVHEIFKKGGK